MEGVDTKKMMESIQEFRKKFEKENGRLYTTEEVVELTDNIRKELRQKGKI